MDLSLPLSLSLNMLMAFLHNPSAPPAKRGDQSTQLLQSCAIRSVSVTLLMKKKVTFFLHLTASTLETQYHYTAPLGPMQVWRVGHWVLTDPCSISIRLRKTIYLRAAGMYNFLIVCCLLWKLAPGGTTKPILWWSCRPIIQMIHWLFFNINTTRQREYLKCDIRVCREIAVYNTGN